MKLSAFFARYPVFTRNEFIVYLESQGVLNKHTQRETLAYHVKKGHLIKIRRNFYAVVSTSIVEPEKMQVDPYLIAGRITDDSIISYHTALEFHGVAYSVFFEFYFQSSVAIKPFEFQNTRFRRINFHPSLVEKKKVNFGVPEYDREGLNVKVTSLERTLVDILDRPDLSGGWEEIWRSMEMTISLDVDLVIEYALLLNNGTLISKLGYFLETHKEQFAVTDNQLATLEQYCQRGKHYLDRDFRKDAKLISRWKLLVPQGLYNQTWEE